MAFRLTEASSSLWPPDRKQMPEKMFQNKSMHLVNSSVLQTLVVVKGLIRDLPGTEAGTVRLRAVTVAMATS